MGDKSSFWISLVTVISLIIAAIPLYLFTTGAYQENLPHEKISNIGNIPSLPVRIKVYGNFKKDGVEEVKDSVLLEIMKSDETMEKFLYQKRGESKRGEYELFLRVGEGLESPLNMGRYRHGWAEIRSEDDADPIISRFVKGLSFNGVKNLERITHFSKEYRASFSLINSNPQQLLVNWNFREIANTYANPFFQKVNHIFNLTMDSQILYFGDLPVVPTHSKDRYEISAKDLQHLLNVNNWKFETPHDPDQSLHMVAFVPDPSVYPLKIRNYDGALTLHESYVIPQWGGIYLLNIPSQNSSSSPIHLNSDPERVNEMMSTFIQHLRRLLGIPDISRDHSIILHTDKTSGISDWEVDYLIRLKVSDFGNLARESLNSLSQIVLQMPDVRVKFEVADLTNQALYHLENLILSSDYDTMIYHARNAAICSEEAFFHSSLLSLLYFSQKAAIYLPFILPVTLTVLIGFLKELKKIRQQ